jgi:hypothetical protein
MAETMTISTEPTRSRRFGRLGRLAGRARAGYGTYRLRREENREAAFERNRIKAEKQVAKEEIRESLLRRREQIKLARLNRRVRKEESKYRIERARQRQGRERGRRRSYRISGLFGTPARRTPRRLRA